MARTLFSNFFLTKHHTNLSFFPVRLEHISSTPLTTRLSYMYPEYGKIVITPRKWKDTWRRKIFESKRFPTPILPVVNPVCTTWSVPPNKDFFLSDILFLLDFSFMGTSRECQRNFISPVSKCMCWDMTLISIYITRVILCQILFLPVEHDVCFFCSFIKLKFLRESLHSPIMVLHTFFGELSVSYLTSGLTGMTNITVYGGEEKKKNKRERRREREKRGGRQQL